jgi:hypothetical protein
MTEVKAEYRFGSKVKPRGVEWQRCPECHLVYGFEERGGEYLRVGKLKMVDMRAECGDCGHPIWWSSTPSPPDISP